MPPFIQRGEVQIPHIARAVELEKLDAIVGIRVILEPRPRLLGLIARMIERRFRAPSIR